MEYPDDWVFDFDKETLTHDFESTSYAEYLSAGEPSIALLKSTSLSFSEYESEVQKILINQNQLLLSFFNTEVFCNESKYFQEFSQKVVKYVEAEILYSNTFWVYGALKDFVRNRVNASLLRTLKFLTALQLAVIEKYNQGNDLENLSISHPEEDSLIQNVEDLLIDYQQLNTLIVYFRKTYGELYNKLIHKNKGEKIEIELIEKILMFCKKFFTANPRAIWQVISDTIPHEVEKELLTKILKSNDDLKHEFDERKKKRHSLEFEKKGIENYIFLRFTDQSLKKFLNDLDQEPRYQPSETSLSRKIDGSYIKMIDSSPQDSKVLRKKDSIDVYNEVPHISNLKSDPSSRNEIILKEESVSDEQDPQDTDHKKKEKKDLWAIIANSPNSPTRNRFVPVDARISQPNYQMPKPGKGNDTLVPGKRILSSLEELKPMRENMSSSLNHEKSQEMDNSVTSEAMMRGPVSEILGEEGRMDKFLKETLNEDFLKSMMEQSIEPTRLKPLNEPKIPIIESKAKTFFHRKRGHSKQVSASNLLSAALNKEEIIEEPELSNFNSKQETKPNKEEESKKDQKVLGNFAESVMKLVQEDVNGMAYVGAKEDKGQDIPDEQLLGNLISKKEDDLDYEENEGEGSDEQDEANKDNNKPLPRKSKKENEPSHNKFVAFIQKMKDQRIMIPGYVRSNAFALNLKPLEDVDKERKKEAWRRYKDRWRTMQVESEVMPILEEEDPTNGLNAAMRGLEYLARINSRNRMAVFRIKPFDNMKFLSKEAREDSKS